MYDLAIEGIQGERRVFFGVFSRSPESVLYRAVQLLEPFIPILRRLRQIADAASGQFRSDGFSRLFATLRQELDEPYLQVLQEHLRALRFPDGVLMSAELGPGNRGVRYILRSLGVARRMLQCGMFVPAERMAASVCGGLFSHFKREEDPTMRRGKLDEELARMRGLVDHMVPGCILLSNESFAFTNEREGLEIARQLVEALLDSGVRVLMVTHLFDLAQGLFGGRAPAPSSCGRSGSRMGCGRFASCRVRPCRRATGRTCTRRSSARRGSRGGSRHRGRARPRRRPAPWPTVGGPQLDRRKLCLFVLSRPWACWAASVTRCSVPRSRPCTKNSAARFAATGRQVSRRCACLRAGGRCARSARQAASGEPCCRARG